MFFDIYEEVGKQLDRGRFLNINFDELLYADDTMLIGKSEKTMTIVFHAIK